MSVPLYYFPLLHNQCIPYAFQGFTTPMDCGLSTNNAQNVASPYPFSFSSKEALRILQEMLHLSRENNSKNHLESHSFLNKDATPFIKGFEDATILRNFMATEEITQQNQSIHVERTLMDCQKVLLLAYSLEEDYLNIHEAQKKLQDSNKILQEMFNAEKEDIAPLPEDLAFEHSLLHSDSSLPTVALWRQIIEASAPFLPEQTVLITAEEAIIKEIHEEYSATFLTNEELSTLGIAYRATNCYTKIVVPFWQLIKHKQKRTTQPWLHRNVTVIMVFPI